MNVLLKRKIARRAIGLGSLGLIVGGVLIWHGEANVGDTLMVIGGITLLIAAMVLAGTPTGDKTPSASEERNSH